jgi:hypothetical protein
MKKNYFQYPPDNNYQVPLYPVDSTSGSAGSSLYYSGVRVTDNARRILPNVTEPQVGKTANNILNIIDQIVYKTPILSNDINILPPLRASISEDGSFSLNWISPDYRVGFDIEKDPKESSWYIITTKRLNETGAYGDLSDKNSFEITLKLLNFIQSNS